MGHKTVSLVLGSGGARGLAHIGVIDWLTDHGFEIKSISGASMGALIGGIYAAGHLSEYKRWVCALEKMDVVRLLDFSFESKGLIKGDRVMGTLRDLIGNHKIEELPISFTAVATDVEAQREVWLNKGPLFDAIRSSIAIPTVFTPVSSHGRLLLDGALVNPIPIAPTLSDKTDITIAVNANARSEPMEKVDADADADKETRDTSGYREQIMAFLDNLQEKLINRDQDEADFFDIITRSLDTMQSTIARFQLAAYSPDVVIEIPHNAASIYEFYRAEEIIDIGRDRAERALRSHLRQS